MSKDPRSLAQPLFDRAEKSYCAKCGTKQPHLKMKTPTDAYATSHCLACRPELLDAPDTGTHPYENLDRYELRRLIRTRDGNLGAGLRVYLKNDGATSIEHLLAHFAV